MMTMTRFRVRSYAILLTFTPRLPDAEIVSTSIYRAPNRGTTGCFYFTIFVSIAAILSLNKDYHSGHQQNNAYIAAVTHHLLQRENGVVCHRI